MILPIFIVSLLGASSAIDLSGCRPKGPSFFDGIVNPTGDIYSPGYKEGKNYPNDIRCTYVIGSAEDYYRVKLSFIVIDIGGRDKIEIHEETGEKKKIGTFCGNESMPPLLSEGNVINIVFTTDSIGTRRGFHIRYHYSNTIKSLCRKGELPCRNRNCYDPENKCNGEDDCGDGTDEENCDYPLPVTECGIRDISGENGMDRIIGGKAAIYGSWPWQVSLNAFSDFPCGHICGGTLINAQWVITANHCYQDNGDPATWRIHLGKHHKYRIDKYEQIRYLERIIVYPNFTGKELLNKTDIMNLKNDYTLLKLNAPVKFTKYVRPACLPKQGFEVPTGMKCWTTGWGVTRGTGSDDVLKEVDMTVADRSNCKGVNILPTRICAKNEKGYQDACHGDSGGPFVCELDDKWYSIGVTSFGTYGNLDGDGLCAMPENRAIFAKVSHISDWIKDQINKYS